MKNDNRTQELLGRCYDRLRQVVVPSPTQQQQQQQPTAVRSQPKTALELCQMMDKALDEAYPWRKVEREAQYAEIEASDWYGLDV